MKLANIPLFFVGDHHGQYDDVFNLIDQYEISDCYLIHLGDGGEGFVTHNSQLKEFDKLNKRFKERKIWYKSIRGNHSDPSYFRGANRIILSNFELLQDYSVYTYNNKSIQFIGGAISIDRSARILNKSYWEEEHVNFLPEKCVKVDILVTHTAPSWCFPQQFNDIVRGWSTRDKSLLADLKEERLQMNKIFDICKPELHLYGHFHSNWRETINNCNHKMLDINEFWEYRAQESVKV